MCFRPPTVQRPVKCPGCGVMNPPTSKKCRRCEADLTILQRNPLHWFEIPVNDLMKAKQFYEASFDINFNVKEFDNLKIAVFSAKEGAAGAAGALAQGADYHPSPDGNIPYFSVTDIEESLNKINANGGKTITPKMKMGELGFIAHFEDSEGNRVGLYCAQRPVNISKINVVNWFEIPVAELLRAKKFYESAFGYNLALNNIVIFKMAWFPMQINSAGSSGSLVQSEKHKPSLNGNLVYLTVNDIDVTLAKINANGGKTLLPKTKMGELGFIAHFEDSEGNRVGLQAKN